MKAIVKLTPDNARPGVIFGGEGNEGPSGIVIGMPKPSSLDPELWVTPAVPIAVLNGSRTSGSGWNEFIHVSYTARTKWMIFEEG